MRARRSWVAPGEQAARELAQEKDARRAVEAPPLARGEHRLQPVARDPFSSEPDPLVQELELEDGARVEERHERRAEAGREQPAAVVEL